jgi:excisionase family DNA binding protein
MGDVIKSKYLSTREVAAILNVTRMTISRLYRLGFFPNAIRTSPGKTAGLRIPQEDLENYIKSQTQGGNSNS